jgi:broad specificity phosphatase PhoE
MTAPLVVRLVRHAETASYEYDAGLTRRGRGQVRERAAEIAATLEGGAQIEIVYAPTERARETAEVLQATLLQRAGDGRLRMGSCVEDSSFRNLQVTVDGVDFEPTQVRRHIPNGGNWAREAEQFWSTSDPMGHWMSTPMLSHESPQSVVRRFLSAIVERTKQHRTEATHLIVATHSGCMRALIAWASCADLGEPANAEEAQVQLHLDSSKCDITYRDRSWTVLLPEGVGAP